jgi:hypothetical protein
LAGVRASAEKKDSCPTTADRVEQTFDCDQWCGCEHAVS